MKDRLRVSDYRFIAVCLALLGGSTWFSVRNFYRAFPEASIDFRVSRGGAQTLAARFLAGAELRRRRLPAGLQLRFRRRGEDLPGARSGPGAGQPHHGDAGAAVALVLPLVPAAAKRGVPRRYHAGGRVRGLRAPDRGRRAPAGHRRRAGPRPGRGLSARRAPPRPGVDGVRGGSEVARPARVDRVFTWKERGLIPVGTAGATCATPPTAWK